MVSEGEGWGDGGGWQGMARYGKGWLRGVEGCRRMARDGEGCRGM